MTCDTPYVHLARILEDREGLIARIWSRFKGLIKGFGIRFQLGGHRWWTKPACFLRALKQLILLSLRVLMFPPYILRHHLSWILVRPFRICRFSGPIWRLIFLVVWVVWFPFGFTVGKLLLFNTQDLVIGYQPPALIQSQIIPLTFSFLMNFCDFGWETRLEGCKLAQRVAVPLCEGWCSMLIILWAFIALVTVGRQVFLTVYILCCFSLALLIGFPLTRKSRIQVFWSQILFN